MPLANIRFLVASDVLLACLFPLAIVLIGYRYFHIPTWQELRELLSLSPYKTRPHSYFSLERAYHSYRQYARLAAKELAAMRVSYGTLGRAGKNVGYKIGYPNKLDRLRHATSLNATITDTVVELALQEFPNLNDEGPENPGSADLGRVREALKHFVRDWSEEGALERERIFAPILDVLQLVPSEERETTRVLVPGCGLGRLAWEISQLGFDTTANELSFFMTLAFRFLLSPKTTTHVNEHTVRPYSHWFSHQLSNDSLFRGIPFPDAVPRLGPKFHLIEKDFMKLAVPPSFPMDSSTPSWIKNDPHTHFLGGYDYVVTLFFIDTSLDAFATLTHIYKLLRPGGVWINLGPLFWTGGAQAKVELCLNEVLSAAEEIGFTINRQQSGPFGRKTVECEYTGDRNAMMRYIYRAEFWVATKGK